MPAYHPQRIEPKWQAYWEQNRDLSRHRPRSRTAPSSTSWTCFPTPAAQGCTWAIPKAIPRPTSSAGTSGCADSTSCTPWAGTPSACPPSSTPCRPTLIPGSPPRPTSTPSAARSSRWVSRTTGTARSIRPTRTITSGRSGSSSSSTTPGTTPNSSGPICKADSAQGKGRPIAELPSPRGTADPDAYRDSKRLAYRAEVPVNWCPALGTVLANEEVIDGKSERGGFPVVRMPLTQWMLRITAYAERLVDDLELVDWPRPIKEMQRNWVGRSEGAEVDFPILLDDDLESWKIRRQSEGFPETPSDDVIRIFTTRPDTLFGATYMVLAPEHPLVDRITTPERQDAVAAYREAGGQQERPRPHRSGQDQDRRLHRRLRDQSGEQPTDSHLDRRLRPDGLRHRGDHGRAGP